MQRYYADHGDLVPIEHGLDDWGTGARLAREVILLADHQAVVTERDRLFAETIEAMARLHAETLAEVEQLAYTRGYNEHAEAAQRTLIEYGGRP